jgi:hypothetical protein
VGARRGCSSGLAVAACAAAAGALAAGRLLLWARLASARARRSSRCRGARARSCVSAGAAIAAAALLRFAALARSPEWLWIDDLSLIAPALDLSGAPSGLRELDPPAPYGVPRAYGSVGVLYLEAYRASLARFGDDRARRALSLRALRLPVDRAPARCSAARSSPREAAR